MVGLNSTVLMTNFMENLMDAERMEFLSGFGMLFSQFSNQIIFKLDVNLF